MKGFAVECTVQSLKLIFELMQNENKVVEFVNLVAPKCLISAFYVCNPL